MTCQHCGQLVTRIDAGPDPRTLKRVYTASPCGHPVTMPAPGVDRVHIFIAPTDGATLATAERRRQITEEGHTPDADERHDAAELAWAAWCLIDRASSKTVADPESPPMMWPWAKEDWKPHKPLRLLIIAAAYLLAEIDRRLARGETP